MSRIKDAVALGSAKLAATFMQVAAVRVYVHTMGKDGYAILVYFTTVMAYVALIDLGILSAYQREVIDCVATGKHGELRPLSKLVGKLVLCAAVFAIPIYAILAQWLPFPFSRATQGLWLFALCGWLHLLGNLAFLFMTTLLSGAGAFRKLSIASGVSGICMPVFGMLAASRLRQPEPVIAALAIGYFLAAVVAGLLARPLLSSPTTTAFDERGRFRSLFKIGIRGYAARLAASFSGSIDRVIIANVQAGVLASYALCVQIAQFFQELLVPVYQMMFPRISGAVLNEEEDRSRTLENYVLGGVALGSSFACVGSGYAVSLMHVWIGDSAPAVALTTIFLGAYKCVDLAGNIIGISHFARGRMDSLIPMFASNTCLTILLTPVVLHRYGMAGVGAMNVCISGLTLLPLLYSVKRAVMPELRVSMLYATCFGLILIGSAFALLAAYGSSQMHGAWAHLCWVLTFPVTAFCCLFVERKVFGAPIPQELLSRWPRIERLLKPWVLGRRRGKPVE